MPIILGYQYNVEFRVNKEAFQIFIHALILMIDEEKTISEIVDNNLLGV